MAARALATEACVVTAACREIFAAGEMNLLEDLVRAFAAEASSRGEGYAVPAEPARAEPDQLLVRTIESVITTAPVLLAIDDVHRMDEESAEALNYVFGRLRNTAFVLLTAAPDDAEPLIAGAPAAPVVVAPLSAEDAAELARRAVPGASAAQIDALVRATSGIPSLILLVADEIAAGRFVDLADPEHLASSITSAQFARCTPRVKRFLQFCSAYGEVTPLRVLKAQYGAHLDGMLAAATQLFVEQRDGNVRFKKAAHAAHLRATLPSPHAVLRDIVAALEALEMPSIAELSRLAGAYRELGDAAAECRALIRSANASMQDRQWTQACGAFERIVELGLPAAQLFPAIYDYTMALRLADRNRDAKRILLDALEGRFGEMPFGRGLLMANLCNVLLSLGEDAQIEKTVDAYAGTFSEAERRQIRAAQATIAGMEGDVARAEELLTGLSADDGDEYVCSKVISTTAMLHAVCGRPKDAAQALAAQSSARYFRRPVPDRFADRQFAFAELHRAGPRALERCTRTPGIAPFDTETEHWLLLQFAAGEWNRLEGYVSQINFGRGSPQLLARATALHVAACALAKRSSPAEAQIAIVAQDLAESNERAHVMTFAFWWAAYALQRGLLSPFLHAALARRTGDTWPFMPVSCLPLGAAEYARQSGDKELTRRLLAAAPAEASAWQHAQWNLARAWASGGAESGRSAGKAAAKALRSMNAPLLAALAARCASVQTTEDEALLDRLGIDGSAGVARDRLTVRERDIVDLVRKGLTNREIAQHLVVSERTVEVHLSHVFAKYDVRRRTELLAALTNA